MTRGATWTCVAVGCTCAIVLTVKAWKVGTELSSALHDVGAAATGIGVAANLVAQTADQLPGKVIPSVTQEVDDLGRLIVARADSQVTALRGDVMRTTKESFLVADARLQSIQNQVDRTVKESLTVANGLRADLQPVLSNSAALAKNVKSITGQVDYALPDFLDCEWNADCFFNRYQGSFKAFEKAMLQAPVFVATMQRSNEQIAGIAVDLHDMTTQIDRRFFHPPPMNFKQKVWAGFKDVIFLGGSAARLAK